MRPTLTITRPTTLVQGVRATRRAFKGSEGLEGIQREMARWADLASIWANRTAYRGFPYLYRGPKTSPFWPFSRNEKTPIKIGVSSKWRRRDSNSRPLACHASALPTELRPRINRTSNESTIWDHYRSDPAPEVKHSLRSPGINSPIPLQPLTRTADPTPERSGYGLCKSTHLVDRLHRNPAFLRPDLDPTRHPR